MLIRKLYIICVFLFAGLKGMSQKQKGHCTCNLSGLSQPIAGKYELVKIHELEFQCHCYDYGLSVASVTDSVVHAIATGSILTVFDIEGEVTVVIKNGSCFTSYSGFRKAFVQKGDSVASGQMLATLNQNDKKMYQLNIQLLSAKAKVLDPVSCLGSLLKKGSSGETTKESEKLN